MTAMIKALPFLWQGLLVTLQISAIVVVIALVLGVLFGLPALKLEGHYLALATFALALAVPQILKYKWLEGLTGGVQGRSVAW